MKTYDTGNKWKSRVVFVVATIAIGAGVLEPVSYTHLDVYKRQLLNVRKLRDDHPEKHARMLSTLRAKLQL